MPVRVLVFNGMSRNAHHQPSVLNALQANQAIRKLLHSCRIAMNDQHLQAGVMIEVGMTGGNNQVVVGML